ncbi:MAG: hypothetical protein AAFS07_11960 [Pseudomonadota bacterium]
MIPKTRTAVPVGTRYGVKTNEHGAHEREYHPTPAAAMSVDELIVRLVDALRLHRLDGFGLTFAKSIVRQAKRRGWSPSFKQLEMMRRLIEELREDVERFVDHGDVGGDHAA